MSRHLQPVAPAIDTDEAVALIGAAVAPGGTWADLGAGGGTFTRALAGLLGPAGHVIAVDSNERALVRLRNEARTFGQDIASIEVEAGDFHRLDDVMALRDRTLDGVLFANALHFTREPESVLEAAVRRIQPGGTLIVVEYDGRPATPWVPYPFGVERLNDVASGMGLAQTGALVQRPSRYGGIMYAAAHRRA